MIWMTFFMASLVRAQNSLNCVNANGGLLRVADSRLLVDLEVECTLSDFSSDDVSLSLVTGRMVIKNRTLLSLI